MTGLTGNMEKQIERRVDEAIELADLGASDVTARAIAEGIYDSEPELMEQLKRPWMVDRLLWMVSRKRRNRRRVQRGDDQLTLPGFEGLPRSIFLPDGHRKSLDDANVTQVRAHLNMLRNRLKHHPKIEQMEAVLELMRKYSGEQPRITWAEVKRREFERREAELSL